MGMGMGMRVKFYHSVLGILFGFFFTGFMIMEGLVRGY
jgi:hypothetical protein